MAFTLPNLPYNWYALEPSIDADTMRLHHDAHHAAYVRNLNAALKDHPELEGRSVDHLIRDLATIPETIRAAVRNNGGGHLNHSMFWLSMAPWGKTTSPKGDLVQALQRRFGSVEEFQKKFVDVGVKHFGSGWVWLVLSKAGRLELTTTANQDSPLTAGDQPILGNDLWEHAYYLNYQNRRTDYLQAWWAIANWEVINQRYLDARRAVEARVA